MSLVTRNGTYIARPASWGIKFEEGKCPRFAIVFACEQYKVGNEWEPINTDEKITGYFTLFNRDGSPNEINLRALHDSLGWDGASIESLDKTDWGDKEVQIVVEDHEYKGEVSKEVRYLNPRDYAGNQMQKADPQVVQSLDQKYGASLRALFKVSKPSNGNGNTSKLPRPTISTPPVNPADAAKQETWKAFIEATPGYESARRAEVFKEIVAASIQIGQDPKTCTLDDWKEVQRNIRENFSAEVGGLIPI